MAAAPVGFAPFTTAQTTPRMMAGNQPLVIMAPPAPSPITRAPARKAVDPVKLAEAAKDGAARGLRRGLAKAGEMVEEARTEAAASAEYAQDLAEGSMYGHAIGFGVLDSIWTGKVIGDDEATPETEGILLNWSLPIAVVERVAAFFVADEAGHAILRGGGQAGITIGLYSTIRQFGAKAAADLAA